MNQNDDQQSESKEKEPVKQEKSEIEFLRCLNDRSVGQKNPYTTFHILATAEDELVKKQFKEMRCEMPGLPRSTFLMVFSPDGTKVASTHGNHNIYVTDVRSGRHIKTLLGHPRTPWCIAFHPTSNQIIASGCLGGQVRIWDLSGGSEVWTNPIQSVIASIAFHPNDRLLVIATYNELYFWDWSKPEPFMHVATNGIKEKVRYVAFDKLGHKLITGITNSPQTRWERVRAPVPSPRPADRGASPYRRRITPRLIPLTPTSVQNNTNSVQWRPPVSREPLSTIPERERRITTCYRDLVQQYEVLVHRYLQMYRPPVMIDQGTDPMETDLLSTVNPNERGTGIDPAIPSTSNSEPSHHPRKSKPTKFKADNLENIGDVSANQSIASTHNEIRASLSSTLRRVTRNILDRDQSTFEITGQSTPQDADERTLPQSPLRDESSENYPNQFIRKIIRNCRDIGKNTRDKDQSTLQGTEQSSLPGTSQTTAVDNEQSTLQGTEESAEPTTHRDEQGSSRSNEPSTSRKFSFPLFPRDSSSSSDDDETHDRRLKEISYNKNITIEEKRAAIYNYLNLTRLRNNKREGGNDTKVKMTSRFVVPVPSTSSSANNSSTPTTNYKKLIHKVRLTPAKVNSNNKKPAPPTKETVYKMRIKCSVASKTATSQEQASDRKNNDSNAGTSDAKTNANNNDNISDLIGYVENMLAKFRQNLEDRETLQSLPSTSRSTLPTTKSMPSKGTNTSSTQKSEKRSSSHRSGRKRSFMMFLHKAKRRNVSNTSSNSSSSDEEDETKRKRSNKVPVNNPEINTSLANILINDHSYAEPGSSDNTNTITESINTNTPSINASTTELNTTIIPPPTTNNETSNFNVELESLESLTTDPEIPPTSNQPSSTPPPCHCEGCRWSDGRTCSQAMLNTDTSTTNSPTYTSTSEQARRRFLSHRLSAFHPTRLTHQRWSPVRERTTTTRSTFLLPLLRSRLNTESPSRLLNFAADEVINYSERDNQDESPSTFHPFAVDPGTDVLSLNPENIGIGNMYSNIVQEIESSLIDVRNIRDNRRLGETSDVLSSFSERLESIINQSNAILRNLASSLDSLPVNDSNSPNGENASYRTLLNYGLMVRNNPEDPLYDLIHSPTESRRSGTNPVASDHTYPLNSEEPQASMSPLMVSLHLTVTHILRQARLLRQQVESIERIDRAMIEVAQLQLMRQMFDELHRHFSSLNSSDNLAHVSSVRQMMAGTRISDSSPYESSNENNPNQEQEPQASTSSTTNDVRDIPQQTNLRRLRKTYPRCIFLMHRHFRRSNSVGLTRHSSSRVSRRNLYRRFLPSRAASARPNIDLSTARGRSQLNLLNANMLPSMVRRLEHFLLEHGRYIGRPTSPSIINNARYEVAEHMMMLRLNNCRIRLTRILGLGEQTTQRNEFASVTVDGASRFGARQTLSSILETLSQFMDTNPNLSTSVEVRSHIWEIIELSLLLSEILMLQIVDSIPPPSGMNLDPERESLSMRIDQMCSRMINSRLSGQTHQLTRSLRLLKITVRHAMQALGQTYTARRNGMLPNSSDGDRDTRRELLYDIHNCLRNLRRHREHYSRSESLSNPTGREWYRTINDLISRYTNSPDDNEGANNETGEASTTSNPVEDRTSDNSSDDNVSVSTNTTSSRSTPPLYRTNNVNLLRNDEPSTSTTRNHIWNVPTVHVNDVPIYESPHSPWHPRFLANRQRLSERLDELRSNGGLFRPRFLHPTYSSINPFEGDLDDAHREQIYDGDIIATVTPNHRIQVWEFSFGKIPNISNALENVVVNECKIHNDASVDHASDGSILVTLLPSGGYMNVTNRLGVYSLEWETLGQCLYVANFEQNAVSVSLSPMNRHLVVGLASRRMPVMLSEKWTIAKIFLLDEKEAPMGKLSAIRELEQSRDTNYMSVNCVRWLPSSGQGLVFATNTGHLRFLT